jgi:hypothetical protein
LKILNKGNDECRLSDHHTNMKKLITFFIFSLAVTMSYAQSRGKIKLYGFIQNVSRGKAPELSEGGGTQTSAGMGRNYRLYAVSPSRIYPVALWLNGVEYGVSVNTIKQTPVTYEDAGNIGAPGKTLVPKTSGMVIQLVPVAASTNKSIGRNAKSLAQSNEMVLVYKQNGKFYYSILKQLSSLDPAPMQ